MIIIIIIIIIITISMTVIIIVVGCITTIIRIVVIVIGGLPEKRPRRAAWRRPSARGRLAPDYDCIVTILSNHV